VRSAAGVALTETSPVDHRHHYGVSMAVPVVNGTSYWGGRTYVRDEGPTLLPNHGRQVGGAYRLSDDGGTLAQDVVWYDEHGGVLLREDRTLAAGTIAGGWSLRWTSLLHATERDLSIESPGTNGRANAGYGGLFWRLPSADSTLILGQGLVGEASVHGSESPWLAFVQRREGAATTLLMVQDPAAPRPWFARVAEYVGAGPALAWDTPLLVPHGERLTVAMGAVVVDRALGDDEADALAAALAPQLAPSPADGAAS
jgi:LacI family transcriptional regulator